MPRKVPAVQMVSSCLLLLFVNAERIIHDFGGDVTCSAAAGRLERSL
jgi:hypothetical protein